MIGELKDTLLDWEKAILHWGLKEGEYDKEFCYDEYETILDEVKDIKDIKGIIGYLEETLDKKRALQSFHDLMWDTKSLMN